jgi:hypothetical protein
LAKRLSEDLRRETASAVPWLHAVPDVPTFVGQEVIEGVADRDAADQRAAVIGDQDCRRDPASGNIDAAATLAQFVEVVRPRIVRSPDWTVQP